MEDYNTDLKRWGRANSEVGTGVCVQQKLHSRQHSCAQRGGYIYKGVSLSSVSL